MDALEVDWRYKTSLKKYGKNILTGFIRLWKWSSGEVL